MFLPPCQLHPFLPHESFRVWPYHFPLSYQWLSLFRGRLYEQNCSPFGSSRCSKNEPGLKIFFVLYDKKMFPVHRRTKSRTEIISYHVFNFQILVLQLNIFDCVLFKCLNSASDRDYRPFRLTDGSLVAHVGKLVRSGEVN